MNQKKLALCLACLSLTGLAGCNDDVNPNHDEECVGMEGQTFCLENSIVECNEAAERVRQEPCAQNATCQTTEGRVECVTNPGPGPESQKECEDNATKCETVNNVASVAKCVDGKWQESDVDCTNRVCDDDNKTCVEKECEDNATKCETVNDVASVAKCVDGKWQESDVDCTNRVCDDDKKTCMEVAKTCDYTISDGSSVTLEEGKQLCDDINIVTCTETGIQKDPCAVGICTEQNNVFKCEPRGCETDGTTLAHEGTICQSNKQFTCTDGKLDNGIDCTEGWLCVDGEAVCRAGKDCVDAGLTHLKLACNEDHDVVECFDGTVRVSENCDNDNADESKRTACSSQNKCESPSADDCDFNGTLVPNGTSICDGNGLRKCETRVLSDVTPCDETQPVCEASFCRPRRPCYVHSTHYDYVIYADNQLTCYQGQKARCEDGVMHTFETSDDNACGAHQLCNVDESKNASCQCDEANHWVAGTTNDCVCADGWGGNNCDCDLSTNQYDDSIGCVECLTDANCNSNTSTGICGSNHACKGFAFSFVAFDEVTRTAYLRYSESVEGTISNIKLVASENTNEPLSDWDTVSLKGEDNTSACKADATKCGISDALGSNHEIKVQIPADALESGTTYHLTFVFRADGKDFVVTSMKDKDWTNPMAKAYDNQTTLSSGEYRSFTFNCENNAVQCNELQPQKCINNAWMNQGNACSFMCEAGACVTADDCTDAVKNSPIKHGVQGCAANDKVGTCYSGTMKTDGANDKTCTADAPYCDPETISCVGCLNHAQCEDPNTHFGVCESKTCDMTKCAANFVLNELDPENPKCDLIAASYVAISEDSTMSYMRYNAEDGKAVTDIKLVVTDDLTKPILAWNTASADAVENTACAATCTNFTCDASVCGIDDALGINKEFKSTLDLSTLPAGTYYAAFLFKFDGAQYVATTTEKKNWITPSVKTVDDSTKMTVDEVRTFSLSAECQADAKRCSGMQHQKCVGGRFWQNDSDVCTQACSAEMGCVACDPNDYTPWCNNNKITSCTSEGQLKIDECVYGCTDDRDPSTPDSCYQPKPCDSNNYKPWCDSNYLVTCTDNLERRTKCLQRCKSNDIAGWCE